MILELPDQEAGKFGPDDLRLELACALYARGRVSAVGGANLAGVDLFTYQGALKEREIPRNYSMRDLQDDMQALDRLFPK